MRTGEMMMGLGKGRHVGFVARSARDRLGPMAVMLAFFAFGWAAQGCSDDSSHGSVCGDGTCQIDESATSCPQDCSCGNGKVNHGEACDGADLDSQNCASVGHGAGTLGCNADCTFDYSGCEGRCGNGILDGTDSCDGTDLGGKSCADLGFSSGNLACKDDCTFDVSDCTGGCGNAVADGTEDCDGADLGNQNCGTVGFVSGSLGCKDDCTFDLSQCIGGCGNGAVDEHDAAFEQCDGADLGGEDCSSLGFSGGILGCKDDCRFDETGCTGGCGNGVAEGAEECDGTDVKGLKCSALTHTDGGTLGCLPDCTFDLGQCLGCGNGVCDNGETASSCADDCKIVQVAIVGGLGCVRKAGGSVWCWGDDTYGQLGDGQMASGSFTPVRVKGLPRSQAVAIGVHVDGGNLWPTACSLSTTGTVWCWGSNTGGRLGIGASSDEFSTALPMQVVDIDDATELAHGNETICVARQGGSVWCWGQDPTSVTPNGNIQNTSSPVAVSGMGGIVKVAAGKGFVCGQKADGDVACCGYNHEGQLGNGTTISSSSPVDVISPVPFPMVAGTLAAKYAVACVLYGADASTAPNLVCWGFNGFSALEDGGTSVATPIIPNRPESDFDAVDPDAHVCATEYANTGILWCWGYNEAGQLGDGTTDNKTTLVTPMNDVVDFAVSWVNTCAIRSDSMVLCWGGNQFGQLGDGTTTASLVPKRVPVP